MSDKSMARMLRLSVVKGQFLAGNITKEEAEEVLSGPLTPGDPSTIIDDRALLEMTNEQIQVVMKNSEAASILSDALAFLKSDKPNDRSERDRYYAIVITDLEKLIAFAEKHL